MLGEWLRFYGSKKSGMLAHDFFLVTECHSRRGKKCLVEVLFVNRSMQKQCF